METTPTEIIEATEALTLENIEILTSQIADASVLIAGILLFFVVVILCYFAYKFFRLFF